MGHGECIVDQFDSDKVPRHMKHSSLRIESWHTKMSIFWFRMGNFWGVFLSLV